MSWPNVLLGECCEIVSGATPDTSNKAFWDGDVKWATPRDLSELDGAYISDTPRKLSQAGLNSCAANILPAGSVLFSSRAPIGHVAINTVPMATNQGFKSLVPRNGRVDAKYLYHWLRAHRRYLEALGNGATFKEVSKAIVSKVTIPLPPVLEQRRLAGILDRADALRAKRRAALEQFDALTRAVFVDMFGDPVENSQPWKTQSLAELVDEARPISYGILMPGPDVADGVRYVRVVDMQAGGINLSGIRRTSPDISQDYRRSLLRPGDLLLSIRGHVGRLAIVPDALNGANITQDSARIALNGAHPVFVRECLRHPSFQRWMERHTKGMAVKGINLGDVKLMPIILPPESLQSQFARRVETIERLAHQQQTSLQQLEPFFASLQHRAFRGGL